MFAWRLLISLCLQSQPSSEFDSFLLLPGHTCRAGKEVPRVLQETPGELQEAPWGGAPVSPRVLQETPRVLQEAPRVLQEVPRVLQRVPRGFLGGFKRLPGYSKRLPGCSRRLPGCSRRSQGAPEGPGESLPSATAESNCVSRKHGKILTPLPANGILFRNRAFE